jgi:hypothetical protein
VVLPGFAAYRIGTATTPSKMSKQSAEDAAEDDESAPPTEEADSPPG